MTSRADVAEVRDLRGDVRHWRRGRATARLGEVLQDAYVAVFSTLVIGAMVTNVVLNVRRELGVACAGSACERSRDLLPWLVALACLGAVLGVARLFGPVFVSPAVDSWLMSAPLDRTALLRGRLLLATGAAVVVAPVVLAAALLGGAPAAGVVGLSVVTTLLALALVAAAAAWQAASGDDAAGSGLVLGALLWLGLLDVATDRGPAPSVGGAATWWLVAAAGCAVAAVAALVVAARRLGRIRRRSAATGGALAPGLSGALAGLDLALVNDLLLAHRWRARATVRSRRGGPAGPRALVWLGAIRLLRDPRPALVVAATVVVTYAAAQAGAGRVCLLVAVTAGFLAGIPLLAAMRVVTRTPSLRRALPFPVATTRWATLAVPLLVLVAYGVGTAPALVRVADTAGRSAATSGLLLGVAVGVGALAAAARWVSGRPPDYARPLVSTPAGGVPTNLYGSIVRGFDVSLLVSLPLLLAPRPAGAFVSLALSAAVLQYLASRE